MALEGTPWTRLKLEDLKVEHGAALQAIRAESPSQRADSLEMTQEWR